ncbi:chloride channel protein [Geomicrobium sp. JCM 19039]|uniref:chloride channel protein n=1 Tax=Geomicrobium sp. JCM 19039 TaxID=1460636 RepID=UPI00045F3A13|nr:chloride channel protein [Geomicrobium sp. JCM 19039]GAK10774.1 hypothetical protein JCM19039_414 [Geomicrobium sp. JCM 19039]
MENVNSYEEMKRKAAIRTFVYTPISLLTGFFIAQVIINEQLPTFIQFLPYIVGALIGVTCSWVFRSEEKIVEKERRYLTKKANKTKARKRIEAVVFTVISLILVFVMTHWLN